MANHSIFRRASVENIYYGIFDNEKTREYIENSDISITKCTKILAKENNIHSSHDIKCLEFSMLITLFFNIIEIDKSTSKHIA